jgi:hypothetical protein
MQMCSAGISVPGCMENVPIQRDPWRTARERRDSKQEIERHAHGTQPTHQHRPTHRTSHITQHWHSTGGTSRSGAQTTRKQRKATTTHSTTQNRQGPHRPPAQMPNGKPRQGHKNTGARQRSKQDGTTPTGHRSEQRRGAAQQKAPRGCVGIK